MKIALRTGIRAIALALLCSCAAMLPGPEARAADEKKPPSMGAKPSAASPGTATPMKSADRMDINSASQMELATLPGIGESRAKAIVKGRPYGGKHDLVKKKILPETVYEKIRDQIVARQK